MTTTSWLSSPDLHDLLSEADLTIEGRVAGASNSTLLCRIDVAGGDPLLCVYKPVAGERPLWDFPEWTLGHRELAAYELSEQLGWHLVPPTTWREDGPAGPGMCQLWIHSAPDQVDVVAPGAAEHGWLKVLDATDAAGREVELVHADNDTLRRIALFDVLANNADRKAGHILTSEENGRLWAIDHGVTFSTEEKLRTVLWGWAGQFIADAELADLNRLQHQIELPVPQLDQWLDEDESMWLRVRLRRLIDGARYPQPSGRWPAIPWPVF